MQCQTPPAAARQPPATSRQPSVAVISHEPSVTVVPDSGTGALAGLAGRMLIDIGPGGAHAYRFEYTLP